MKRRGEFGRGVRFLSRADGRLRRFRCGNHDGDGLWERAHGGIGELKSQFEGKIRGDDVVHSRASKHSSSRPPLSWLKMQLKAVVRRTRGGGGVGGGGGRKTA